jgi:hypothetical protein
MCVEVVTMLDTTAVYANMQLLFNTVAVTAGLVCLLQKKLNALVSPSSFLQPGIGP